MGAFVEGSLIAGERIEATAEVSWLSQFWLYLFAVVLCFTFVLPVLLIAVAVLNVISTELAVTNKKVIGKTGFISRTSIDLPLSKLESINVDQGLIGRMLGYGRVTITGVGGNAVSIPHINAPLQFRRTVMQMVDQ